MSKISKFIICCIAVIISIVSLCVPTYCADISSSLFTIDLVDEFPNYNNYYNANNVSYVTYKNFRINRFGRDGGTFVLYGTNIEDLPTGFYNGTIFEHNYTTSIYGINLNVESTYRLAVGTSSYSLHCNKFEILNISDLVLNMKPSENSFVASFPWCPFDFLSGLNGKILGMHIYGGFQITYDIDYNGQYFYNDTFCSVLNMYITNGISNTLTITNQSDLKKSFILKDNYSDNYNSDIYYSSESFNNKILYFKNILYSDRYISSVDSSYLFNNIVYGNVYNLTRLYFSIDLKYVDYDSIDSINLFSGNSTGSGGAVGSLIPNGSNNFYKTAEWWDIPSHLYNFFIYLIFDAPIISNFTNLVMVIINFIVEVFDFIIGLFTGINNIFFISIFVGIIVLIFLLKIIFKG